MQIHAHAFELIQPVAGRLRMRSWYFGFVPTESYEAQYLAHMRNAKPVDRSGDEPSDIVQGDQMEYDTSGMNGIIVPFTDSEITTIRLNPNAGRSPMNRQRICSWSLAGI